MSEVRTRFAPSPTGFLHIGSLRTVLFSYLVAKSNNGKLVLRVEDTDQARQVEGATEKLIEILNWVNIEFDEGPHVGGEYGPYVQSERLDLYKKHAQKLIDNGHAYYCFCTAERLKKLREKQQKEKKPPRYDRKCLNISQKEVEKLLESNKPYVIRQKMPQSGEVIVHDELRGEIKFNAEELEDHVLLKSDGFPTYQLAVVVDDHLMKISHVLRGEEWIPSFPKNVLLYKGFGWDMPKFIHTPLILNKEGGKLSKRQGDVTVEDFKDIGYLPEALINFNALLGWHAKSDQEIFSLNELIKEFKTKDIGTSPAVFDTEKLDFLNGYWIRQKNLDELVELCKPYLESNLKKTSDKDKQADDFIKKVVALEQERLKKLSEIGELTEFFFVDELSYEPDLLLWKKLDAAQTKNNLEKVYELLGKIPEKNWTNDSIEDAIITYLKAKELKVGDYLWPMRAALTGEKASPSPFDVAEVLGKDNSLKRIKIAIKML